MVPKPTKVWRPLLGAMLAVSCCASARAMQGAGAQLIERLEKTNNDAYFIDPLDGAVYPADFPPPTFRWRVVFFQFNLSTSTSWELNVFAEGKSIFRDKILTDRPLPGSQGFGWTPPVETWKNWTGKTITLQLSGSDGINVHKVLPVTIEIDNHNLPDDVFLRYVEASNKNSSVNIHYLWVDPSTQKRREILSMDSKTRCIGCHSAGSNTSSVWLLQQFLGTGGIVDGKRSPKFDRRVLEFKPNGSGAGPGLRTTPHLLGIVFPRQSPAGDKIAFSNRAGKGKPYDMYDAGAIDNLEHSEPFEEILFGEEVEIYDFKTRTVAPLPGASIPGYSQINPSWSPDGKYIAFTRYQDPSKMSIYVVPFNDGKGGVAVPLRGASDNGAGNYFPEYSPDGKWIAFCRADTGAGLFARDSSDIYLVPANGGVARRLEFNVDGVMDSWHSWSSDSRWLLYSSKRGGISTRAYIARIYEDGRAAAPVELDCGLRPGQRVNLPFWTKKGERAPIPIETLDPPFGEDQTVAAPMHQAKTP